MTSVELLRFLLDQHPQGMTLFMTVLLAIGAIQYFLGPKQDWVESYRRKYYTQIHELLTLVGAFGVASVSKHGKAATITIDSEDLRDGESPEDYVERVLYQHGFHRNALAALKYRHSDAGREWSEGSWVKRPSLLASRQLHLTLMNGKDPYTIECYVHDEPSNVRHPFKHLRSNDMHRDRAKQQFRRILNETELEYST